MSNSALVFALSALKKANTANERIDNLPLPMVFKGSLGTGGTISTLPTASSENEGFVYIVITDGTYAGQSAKAGDTFVSDGSSWVLVPSADEPSPIDDSVTSTALTWSSKKISDECKIKSFNYTGDGQNTSTIIFPTKPSVIFIKCGVVPVDSTVDRYNVVSPFVYGAPYTTLFEARSDASLSSGPLSRHAFITYEGDNIIHLTGLSPNQICNHPNREYTVYYI